MCTVGRRWCIYPTFIFLSVIQRWLVTYLAFEDLFVGLPKIFREKGVYNWVHRRIAVSQAVCSYSEEKGGLSQWENSKFSPEVNHVMRQPGDAKNHYHHQHGLCCLRQGKENTDVWWALEEPALNLLQNHYWGGGLYWERTHFGIFIITDFTPLPIWALFCIVNYCKENLSLENATVKGKRITLLEGKEWCSWLPTEKPSLFWGGHKLGVK